MRNKNLLNIKGAGRMAIHDRGIRHIARDQIKRTTPLHLTIKIESKKAGIKNKNILTALHHSIKNARLLGLRILHYSLEYDHVHLLVEADNNGILGRGMQSFGISFSKGINKIKQMNGRVFKSRYHFRKLKTPSEIKNVLNYILRNGIKHKHSSSILNPYNSFVVINDFSKLYPGFEISLNEIIHKSLSLVQLRQTLRGILSPPKHFLIKKLFSMDC
jgi:REP element-mobilizing transposase RayT